MTGNSGSDARAGGVFIQPRVAAFERYARLARAHGYGFEIIELADPTLDDLAARALTSTYRDLLRTSPDIPLTMHGPYIDLYVNSPDPFIRQASGRRIIDSLNYASELGVGRVIFHTNHLPCTTKPEYTVAWREENIAFWTRICGAWPGEILLENMWDDTPDLLVSVIEGVGCDRFAACLDVGHANIFSPVGLTEWIAALAGSLRYVHVSDNHGVADDALPPGAGNIDWQAVSRALHANKARTDVMLGIGLGGIDAVVAADAYLQQEHVFPYGGR